MSPCQWGRSGGYSCTWICFNICLSIIYFIWCTASYTMKQTCLPQNIKRSTKLRGAKRSPELTFRSMEFHIPENLIFPALWPLLFNIYICDLFFENNSIDIAEYADGNTLYVCSSDLDSAIFKIQKSTKRIFRWFHNNNLISNAEKQSCNCEL